jgi:biopolymer transport protein ExbB/TolQ
VARALRSPIGAARLALALLALGAGGLAAQARAGTPSPRHGAQLDATVRFLQEDQNADGGFGGEPGAASDPDFTAWVAMALAAAGVNPRSQEEPGRESAYTYLAENASALTLTTDFERALLAVDATEAPPGPLGGVDLVARILERRLPDGSFVHEAGGTHPWMNDTIFAILALSPVPEPAVEAAVHEAALWVVAQQNRDGSWPAVCPKSGLECSPPSSDPPDNVDMTGAAIEALNAAGLTGSEAQARALEYLHGVQLPDGGLPESIGEGESNVASTAWAVQGVWAAGGDPESWRTGSGGASEEPLDYMTSLQQPDGHIRYRASRESLGVWMTAYVLPALAGRPLPIVPPPALSPPPSEGAGAGKGGGAAAGGGGVIAGGGGTERRGGERRSRLGQREGDVHGGWRECGRSRGKRGRKGRGRAGRSGRGGTWGKRPPAGRACRARGRGAGAQCEWRARRRRPGGADRERGGRGGRRRRPAGQRDVDRRAGRPTGRQSRLWRAGPAQRRRWGRRRTLAGARDRRRGTPGRLLRSRPRAAAPGAGVVIGAAVDLGDGLAQIATALRVPVLIAAIAVLLLCALELGRFGAEWWRRRVRTRAFDLRELTARAIADPAHADHYAAMAPGSLAAGAVVGIASGGTIAPRATEHALARYELAVQRRLDRTRLLVRAGPAIGLMGTLIPLAPGLAALGNGDVSSLAESLRDAFGATVVGLLVGTVAFGLTLARTRMYTEDLADLEQGAET